MGVKGGEVRAEEKRPFLSLLLYCLSCSTQQNKTALSQQLSTGPRSPGDRWNKQGYSLQVNYQHRGFRSLSLAPVL